MIRYAAIVLASALAAAASLLGACGGGQPARKAEIDIHFSHFQQEDLTVRTGQPIRITLKNEDPIEHEWIVGDAETHARHRTGTEPYHDTRPTEVTVPAFSSRVTTVSFNKPGDYLYICHLPGHEAFGMVGTVIVTN